MRPLSLPALWLVALFACGGAPASAPTVKASLALPVVLDTKEPPHLGVDALFVGRRGPYLLERSGAFRALAADSVGELGPRDPRSEAPSWRSVTEMNALDGTGRWALAVDASGAIQRLRPSGGLEPMNARLGVSGRVLGLTSAGESLAVLTVDGLQLVSRDRVRRVALSGTAVAGASAAGVVALKSPQGIVAFEIASGRTRWFPLVGVHHVAVTAAGTVACATDRAIYLENGSGVLTLRYVASEPIGALATSGERLWFSEGPRVGAFDNAGGRVSRDLGFGSVSNVAVRGGELWALASARAHRLVLEGAWPADIQSIVAARCGECHRSGGRGGLDLSTPERLRQHAEEVALALSSRSMPPAGHSMTDADRMRLMTWVGLE